MRGYLGATAAAQAAAVQAAAAQTTPPDPGQHFTYGPPTQVVAADATVSATFTVLNRNFEADFLVASRTGSFKCQIQVGSRFLSNIPIADANHFGTAQNPLPLLAPLQLRSGDIVTLIITDTSGAQNTIDIGFIGRELNS